MDIIPKVIAREWLEFEPAHFEVAIQYIIHNDILTNT